jgi:hypothetical protein
VSWATEPSLQGVIVSWATELSLQGVLVSWAIESSLQGVLLSWAIEPSLQGSVCLGPSSQVSKGSSCLGPSSRVSMGSSCLGPTSQVSKGSSCLALASHCARTPACQLETTVRVHQIRSGRQSSKCAKTCIENLRGCSLATFFLYVTECDFTIDESIFVCSSFSIQELAYVDKSDVAPLSQCLLNRFLVPESIVVDQIPQRYGQRFDKSPRDMASELGECATVTLLSQRL